MHWIPTNPNQKKKEVKTKYGQVKTGNAKTWDDTQEKKAGYTTK